MVMSTPHPPADADPPKGRRRLDDACQVVGVALRLERDGPLCPVRVPERHVPTSQAIETREEEAINRIGEIGWPEEPISVREGDWLPQ